MGVVNIQHFALQVPELSIAKAFYDDFGLNTDYENGKLICRCEGRDQIQVVLSEGKRKRLHYVSFGTTAAHLEGIRQRLTARGVAFTATVEDSDIEGVWFKDFDGMLTNVQVAEEAPWDEAARVTFNAAEMRRVRSGRTALMDEKPIKPRRLGHVVLFSTDPGKKVAFYNDVFQLRLSDTVASFLSFLHSSGGSDHHIVAFGKSTSYGLHHAGFDVATTDEVGTAARQMVNKGYIAGWGPGRHFVGSNTFAYVRDPWNSMHEYFSDMDFIHDGENWQPQDWVHLGTRSIWGDSEPPDFAKNFETPELSAASTHHAEQP